MDVGLVVFGCFGLASLVAIVAIVFGRAVNLKSDLKNGFEVRTADDSAEMAKKPDEP